jgi:hypothetical protein
VGKARKESEFIYRFVIVGVRTNEKPHDYVVAQSTDGAIVSGDPDRPYILKWRKLLKSETGMMRIRQEQAISVTALATHAVWEISESSAEVRVGF